jgi:drug/metabolite transporter (DMT)-like permease
MMGLRRRPLLGVCLILLMAAGFAGMDTAVRLLGGVLPVVLMLWLRYTFQAVVMAVWLARSSTLSFHSAHPRFQVLRAALLLFTSAMIFFGLQYMPVPELTSINMLAPLLVTLLAAWLLHERVSRLRWALVGGGLLGALVVIRPGSGLFGWAVCFPLAGVCTYAAYQVLTSRMSSLDNPYTTHFWTGLIGMLLVTPLLLLDGRHALDAAAAATSGQWGVMLLIAVLGTAGHLLLILALGMAPTATLMPFIYSQIPLAVGLSWLVFRQWPDAWAWVGMAVIAACGATAALLNLRSPRALHVAAME